MRTCALPRHVWLRLSVLAVLLIGLAIPAGAATAATASAEPAAQNCQNIELKTELPKPSSDGYATRRIVTLDENCAIQEGPVETVALSDLHQDMSKHATATMPDIKGVSNQPTGYTNLLHSKNEVYDPAWILLTGLYSENAWSGDWSRITSYSVRAWSAWHTESNGYPGWYLVGQSQNGGCSLPCASATFNQHAEFGYWGAFDPSGKAYYNILDNSETLNGNSSSSCRFRLWTKTWFSNWKWVATCW